MSIIKISTLYRFKVGSIFETQCTFIINFRPYDISRRFIVWFFARKDICLRTAR